jgi:HSP20 family protein
MGSRAGRAGCMSSLCGSHHGSNDNNFESQPQGECTMAEKDTAIAPTRGEQRLGRPAAWGGSPFGMLQRFADEMDRLFDDFGFGGRSATPSSWGTSLDVWTPNVEMFQRNNELTIRADLPGLKKDEVSVDVTDNAVTIHGERKREHEEEREGLYRSERTYGTFRRLIQLPEGAMAEQAKASFRDGVLEITMPAPPSAKGRRLEITDAAKK